MRGTFVSRSLCNDANIGVAEPSGATVLTSFLQTLYLYKKWVKRGVSKIPIKNEITAKPNIFKTFYTIN